MEKISQDNLNAKNDIILEDSENKEVEDIQFEEVVDIDEIQKKLQERIYENDPETEEAKGKRQKAKSDAVLSDEGALEMRHCEEQGTSDAAIQKEKIQPALTKIDPNAKKYVVYVDSDNIDFMENLSVNERKAIINKILKEQNEAAIKTKELNARKRFVTHVILACITFIIFFPLTFIGVNKALMATINNYEQAKENFRKLYKEQGKIKIQVPGQVESIKY